FTGRITQAQVQQARSQQIQAELALARLRRDAQRQVRTAHADLGSSIAQTQAYQKAVELADRNLRLQQREYRLGLINNLELLQSMTDLQQLRQKWLRAKAAAKFDDVLLKIA